MRRLLAFADAVAIALAVGALAVLEGPLGSDGELGVPFALSSPVLFVVAATALWVAMAALRGMYHIDDRHIEHSIAEDVGQMFQLSAVWAWLLFLGSSLLTAGVVSVAPVAGLWLLMIPFALVSRMAARTLARTRTWYRQSVFVVGKATDTARVSEVIDRHPEYGLSVERMIELHDASGVSRVRHLIEAARDANVARVIFTSSYEGLDERTGALRFLAEEGIKVDLIPGDSDVFRTDAELHFMEGLPLLTLPTTGRPRSAALMKRAIDMVIAGSGLALMAPVFAYCAVRIKLDSRGPVFFRQDRTGRKGESFGVLKFRTMVADADEIKHTFDGLNTRTDGMFKVAADPRITRFGARLRRCSLDELPQLINVLRGEMSLVGPRPLIEEESSLVDNHYLARFNVKPGITGPWQVLGRSDIPFQMMLKLDYAYVTSWSIAEDLKILVRTASAMAHRRGAY